MRNFFWAAGAGILLGSLAWAASQQEKQEGCLTLEYVDQNGLKALCLEPVYKDCLGCRPKVNDLKVPETSPVAQAKESEESDAKIKKLPFKNFEEENDSLHRQHLDILERLQKTKQDIEQYCGKVNELRGNFGKVVEGAKEGDPAIRLELSRMASGQTAKGAPLLELGRYAQDIKEFEKDLADSRQRNCPGIAPLKSKKKPKASSKKDKPLPAKDAFCLMEASSFQNSVVSMRGDIEDSRSRYLDCSDRASDLLDRVPEP